MRVRMKLEGSDILEMYPKPEPLDPVEVERRYREWREAVSAALGYCLEHEDMTPVWLSEDGEEPAEWRDVAWSIEEADTQTCRDFTRGEPILSYDGDRYITIR